MSKNNKIYNLKIIKAGKYERYKYYELAYVVPDNGGYTGKRGQSLNREKSINQSMARAKEKIFGYILANDWEYWATQTFCKEVIDRYDLDEILKRYNKKLKNLKSRKYSDLKWLIVPEKHKDGAWHLHMLMSGIPKDRLRYSGHDYYSGSNKRPIYNWLDTVDYGFNHYVYIGGCGPEERVRIAIYISKYITKELAEDRYNKKKYWVSKGLGEPKVTSTYTLDDDVIPSAGVILSHNRYHIKDKETGDIINTVDDITLYNSCL